MKSIVLHTDRGPVVVRFEHTTVNAITQNSDRLLGLIGKLKFLAGNEEIQPNQALQRMTTLVTDHAPSSMLRAKRGHR